MKKLQRATLGYGQNEKWNVRWRDDQEVPFYTRSFDSYEQAVAYVAREGLTLI